MPVIKNDQDPADDISTGTVNPVCAVKSRHDLLTRCTIDDVIASQQQTYKQFVNDFTQLDIETTILPNFTPAQSLKNCQTGPIFEAVNVPKLLSTNSLDNRQGDPLNSEDNLNHLTTDTLMNGDNHTTHVTQDMGIEESVLVDTGNCDLQERPSGLKVTVDNYLSVHDVLRDDEEDACDLSASSLTSVLPPELAAYSSYAVTQCPPINADNQVGSQDPDELSIMDNSVCDQDDIEAFVLDEEFDYDNVVLSKKYENQSVSDDLPTSPQSYEGLEQDTDSSDSCSDAVIETERSSDVVTCTVWTGDEPDYYEPDVCSIVETNDTRS